MGSMKRRVAVLENEWRSEATAANPEAPPEPNELYEMEMGFTAVKLVQGTEPKYTLDEAGTFLTLDGQCALSRRRVDIQALLGPRTKQQQESIPPERWGRFLAADDDAADLLERIIGRAGDAAVPDDYREPNHDWNDLAEVCDQLGQHEFGSVFADADERETTRRMTWALIHDPGALAMLSELTRRRDAFVAEEGTSNK